MAVGRKTKNRLHPFNQRARSKMGAILQSSLGNLQCSIYNCQLTILGVPANAQSPPAQCRLSPPPTFNRPFNQQQQFFALTSVKQRP